MYSPRISRDMMTVNMGAELFTVSAKDTATFFRLTKPRTTVMNLGNKTKLVLCSAHAHAQLVHYTPPHESDKQHDHDEVGGVLGSGLVLVQAAGDEHLQAADDGGGQHLHGT